jgi:hypothetical protein
MLYDAMCDVVHAQALAAHSLHTPPVPVPVRICGIGIGDGGRRAARRTHDPHARRTISIQVVPRVQLRCQPSPTLLALHLTTRPSQYSALHYTALSSAPHYTTMVGDVIRTALLRALLFSSSDYRLQQCVDFSVLKPPHVAHIVLFDAGPTDDACLHCF